MPCVYYKALVHITYVYNNYVDINIHIYHIKCKQKYKYVMQVRNLIQEGKHLSHREI